MGHTSRDDPEIPAHQKIEARTGPARASRKAAGLNSQLTAVARRPGGPSGIRL